MAGQREDLGIGSLIGRAIRTTRIEAGWSQRELAERLATTQPVISRLESASRGHLDTSLVSAALQVLGIRVTADSTTLGLAGRREQRDLVHARCCGYVGRRLSVLGWDVRHEVEVGTGRYRGWIDLLAYRASDRCLFCGEIKTEIDNLGQIQRTLGWYEREAWVAARRLSWRPKSLASALVILCSAENDARARSNREILAREFPARASEVAAWLAMPDRIAPPRGLAMIDPRSRRLDWLFGTTMDGRRRAAPYADYRAAAAVMAARPPSRR